MEIRSLCVFCGSNTGVNKVYKAAAQAMARMLVRRDCRLVYGGGSVGLMGVIADTVLAEGGQVTGIIPSALATKDVIHQGLTETHVTDDMHERSQCNHAHPQQYLASEQRPDSFPPCSCGSPTIPSAVYSCCPLSSYQPLC